jgi:hypothetical protein
LSGGWVAPVPVAVPANVLIKFVSVEEEPLSVAVSGDRPPTSAGAERFGAEPQVTSRLDRRHPRARLRGGDACKGAGSLGFNEPFDLGAQEIEKRGSHRHGHV